MFMFVVLIVDELSKCVEVVFYFVGVNDWNFVELLRMVGVDDGDVVV